MVCSRLLLLNMEQQSCANESSAWVLLPINSTEVTMDSHFDEEDNLESQVIFGHLESTVAVRCLARNEMAAVSREIKLVSNGRKTHTQGAKHKHNHTNSSIYFPFQALILVFPCVPNTMKCNCRGLSECE